MPFAVGSFIPSAPQLAFPSCHISLAILVPPCYSGSGRPRRVVVGKSPMLLAIEQGLCTMRAGEIAVVSPAEIL